MFPMISNLSEFEEAKETLLIELEKEKRRGRDVPKKVNVGLMIEVPALLFQLPRELGVSITPCLETLTCTTAPGFEAGLPLL